MIDFWYGVVPVSIMALIMWFTCKAAVSIYFKAKESFVDRLIEKLKGANDGKK